MEITSARFPNHSLAKQLAITMTDGALAIPTALGKFALTISGRLRIILVSSLTLRYFQIWLNKAMKFLPLCPANHSFEELKLPVQKSILVKSDSLQCKLSQDNKNALLWSGEATWQWTPTTQISTTLKVSTQASQNKESTEFFFYFFEYQSLSWKIASDRTHQPDLHRQEYCYRLLESRQTRTRQLGFMVEYLPIKCFSQYSITKLLSWTIKTTISKGNVETFLEVRL